MPSTSPSSTPSPVSSIATPLARRLALCLGLGVALFALGCSGASRQTQGSGESSTSPAGDGATATASGGGGSATSPSSGYVLATRPPSSPWLSSAAFAGDGKSLFFATTDGAVWEVDLTAATVSPRHTVAGGTALELVHGGNVLIDRSDVPRVLGVRRGTELLRLPDWKGATHATVSPNGEHMLLGADVKLGRWSLPEQAVASVAGERIEEFVNRQMAETVLTLPGPATAVDVGDTSRFVVAADAGGKQGSLFVWNPDAPETLKSVGRTNGSVTQLALSPDETRMVAINADNSVVVAPTTKQAFESWAVGKSATSAEWLDSGWLVLHETDGATRAYDPASGAVQWELAPATPLRHCWSVGQRLACSDGTALHLLSATTGDHLAWIAAITDKSAIVLPDGTHVGQAPASWVAAGDGSAPDEATWSELEGSARVLRVLQNW